MATTRSFQDMLNEHLHYDLLMEELTRRNYLLEKVERDDDWKGGTLIVPFEGSMASSYRFGSLTHEEDISEFDYVRGQVGAVKEIWGSLVWNQRDLIEHDGSVKEKSFLKNLPGQIDRFMMGFKDAVSVSLLQGSYFASATVNGTNGGVLVVDRPERFCIGQKVQIDDDDSAPVTAYVRNIDINTNEVTFYDLRTGGTAVDLTAYTVAANARVYFDDAQTNNFTSLRDQLLSATNGGSASLFGQTKTLYPYLQALNHNGGGISATNFLDKLFDFWTTTNQKGKGHASHAVMSYKHLGTAMKLLESGGGANGGDPTYNSFRHVNTKSSVYGYTEISITGTKGSFDLVGVHEMPDDIIYLLDWSSMKFHTNGGFRKHTDMDGNNYYTIRAESGYKYICDMCLFGEFVVNAPSRNGIIHSITY